MKFLQGLVTNDVRRFGEAVGEQTSNVPTPNLSSVSVPPMYAAMLTPQGRFLYDMFIYRPSWPVEKLDQSGSGPGPGPGPNPDEFELFADVDGSVVDELLGTLNKYRLRSKVEIESAGEEFICWQRFGGNLNKDVCTDEPEASGVGYGGAVDRLGSSTAQGGKLGWQWYKDPRLDCLGFRGIFPADTTPPLVEADKETDEQNYLLWRLEKGVAEGSIEMPKGEAIPLEYNFAGLNAISFDKGCYVGQELIARSHHRGVVRKRLIPLRFLDDSGKELEQEVAPKSDVLVAASGKKAGTVTTALGSRGLGLLRLEEAFKSPGTLVIKGHEGVKVETIRPDWWPSEWSVDGQQDRAAA